MKIIRSGNSAYANILVYRKLEGDKRGILVYGSMLHENENILKSIAAAINLGNEVSVYDTEDKENITHTFLELTLSTTSARGNSMYTVMQGVSLLRNRKKYNFSITHRDIITRQNIQKATEIENPFFLIPEGQDKYSIFYNVIFSKFPKVPMKKDFAKYLFFRCKEENYLKQLAIWYDEEASNSKHRIIDGYHLINLTEEILKSLITEGIKEGAISIAKKPQDLIVSSNLDEYLDKYGKSIIEKINNKIVPLSRTIDKLPEHPPLIRKPKPSQASKINGMSERLNKAKYGFLIETMGCGKSYQSLAVMELFNILKKKKGGYRAIAMCPAHLPANWEEEAREAIKGLEIKILRELRDVQELIEHPPAKDKKILYVVSKDFIKLNYSEIPAVKWVERTFYEPVYATEERVDEEGEPVVDENGNRIRDFVLYDEEGKYTGKQYLYHRKERKRGWVCPECGKFVYPLKNADRIINGEFDRFEDEEKFFDRWSFHNKNTQNHSCCHCGASLWQPNVTNLGTKATENKWIKVAYKTGFTQGEKTGWVYKDFIDLFISDNHVREETFRILNDDNSRKVSPIQYLRVKGYKGMFDIGIFDEVHKYQNPTGQGHAFHILSKLSKKSIGLTGTLFNGTAQSIWYMLWRLDPRLMISKGYRYDNESLRKFNEEYGSLEEELAFSNEEAYLSNTRARKVATPRVTPGISPKLYEEFLIESCIFMDITEVGDLPPLIEKPIFIEMDEEQKKHYTMVEHALKEALSKREKGASKLLGAMLQTLLTYPDKPFGWEPILHPYYGHEVCTPPEMSQNVLYPKEEQLLDLIKAEMIVGRKCLVYCTSTGKNDIQGRLQAIFTKEGIKTEVLTNRTCKTDKRAEWVKKKVSQGMQVLICNPKLVETGLNLLQFPTIIFLQTGYELSVMWQSSRRSWRIGQKEPVKVFYMCYRDTLQARALNIMGAKLKAAASIQGEFSAEGIQALSSSTNVLTQLAQELYSKEEVKEKETVWDDLDLEIPSYKRIIEEGRLEELLYQKQQKEKIANELSIKEAINKTIEDVTREDQVIAVGTQSSLFDVDMAGTTIQMSEETSEDKSGIANIRSRTPEEEKKYQAFKTIKEIGIKTKKKVHEEQFSLFAFI